MGAPLAKQIADHFFQRIAIARIDAVAQQRLDLRAHFIQESFSLFGCRAASPEMNVNLTGYGKYRRCRIRVARINRGYHLIQIGFGQTDGPVKTSPQYLWWKEPFQPRQALLLEHCFQLIRRSRQQHNGDAVLQNPLPRRSAPVVRQHLRAIQYIGLALVDLGHFSIETPEAFRNQIADLLMKDQLAAKSDAYRVARQVIFGRTKSSG